MPGANQSIWFPSADDTNGVSTFQNFGSFAHCLHHARALFHEILDLMGDDLGVGFRCEFIAVFL